MEVSPGLKNDLKNKEYKAKMFVKDTYTQVAPHYHLKYERPEVKYAEDYTFFKALGNIQGKTILDLGCGEGKYTTMMSNLSSSKIVGVDICPRMIANAEKNNEDERITYMTADCSTTLPVKDQFNVVTAMFVLLHSSSE